MLTREEIQKIHDFCATQDQVAAVYVFGSRARDKERPQSDMDLALITKHGIQPMQRVNLETEFSNLLHRDVDVVIFHLASALLQHQILKYGQLLYEADPGERIRQEVFARKEYLDSAFLYRKLGPEGTYGRY